MSFEQYDSRPTSHSTPNARSSWYVEDKSMSRMPASHRPLARPSAPETFSRATCFISATFSMKAAFATAIVCHRHDAGAGGPAIIDYAMKKWGDKVCLSPPTATTGSCREIGGALCRRAEGADLGDKLFPLDVSDFRSTMARVRCGAELSLPRACRRAHMSFFRGGRRGRERAAAGPRPPSASGSRRVRFSSEATASSSPATLAARHSAEQRSSFQRRRRNATATPRRYMARAAGDIGHHVVGGSSAKGRIGTTRYGGEGAETV